MKKKLISILLTVCMVLALLPTAAFAADSTFTASIPLNDGTVDCTFVIQKEPGDDSTGGTVVIGTGTDSAISTEAAGDLVIPATVEHNGITYTVVGFGVNTFINCTLLKTVKILAQFPHLSASAFSTCSGLESVTIPSSVKTIGASAFSGCSKLEIIDIPAGVTTIESVAFAGCAALKSVTIPEGVDQITESLFGACSELVSVTIPPSVKSIGKGAFWGCSKLESVEIPNDVTTIGFSAFRDCVALENVTIPNGVTAIADNTFDGCSMLKSVTIPTSVDTIGQDAFSWCAALASVTIPSSVTTIGNSAFMLCKNLSSVTFEAETPPTTFGTNVFSSTHANLKIYVPAGSETAYKTGTTSAYEANIVETSGSLIYGISVDVPNFAHTFPSAEVGYGAQAAKTVWITNTGNQPTGPLTVSLSGGSGTSFELADVSIENIEVGGSHSFTVTPKLGLGAGSYTETVVISGDNDISKSFTVSFTVSPVAPNTYAVTISDGGTGATGAGSYASGASVSINAGSKSGYTFSGWTSADVTFADASSAATSFTMPDKAVTVTANWTYNGGGGGSSSGGSSTPSTPGASATVDGKTADLGKTETRGDTTTAILDQTKLNKSLESAKSGGTLTVPVTTTKDSAAVELTAESVAKMAEKDMTLEVKSGKTSYTLPVNAMDTKDILTQLGATDASKVAVTITITNEKSTTVPGEKLVGTPVSFTVSAAYGGKTVVIGRFTSMVSRTIEITKAQAEVLSTAVVLEKGGDLRHVPTRIFTQGGKWCATFSSMTNSTYALIERAASFTDVTGQWYADAANELASRAITKGVFDTSFQGEKAITRAEFAALLVNAFGLPKDAKADFSDVASDAWYSQAVATASAYGIANGIGGGKFSPDATITRQQAMVMIHRAATIVGYTGGGTDTGTFTDRAEVGAWAAEGVAFNLANGLIVGNDGKINPNDTITRAQTATVLLRLLQKAELVDVRTEA